MDVRINLPYKIITNALEDFAFLESHMRQIIPDFHIEPIGFVGYHVGLAYVGSLTNNVENIDMQKQLIAECALDIERAETTFNDKTQQEGTND